MNEHVKKKRHLRQNIAMSKTFGRRCSEAALQPILTHRSPAEPGKLPVD
jgi:hypothetical protein